MPIDLQRSARCPASPQAIQVIVVALGLLILCADKIGFNETNFMGIGYYQMESTEDTSSVTVSDSSDVETPLIQQDLAAQVEMLAQASNLLLHRLDSIERALDRDTFELANLKVRVKDGPNAESVKTLVATLNLTEPFLIGDFLRALNPHIIQHDLVDLNDLEIRTTPHLRQAFYLQPTDIKIPYAKLLLGLPHMFV
jgi:hypothetical protein